MNKTDLTTAFEQTSFLYGGNAQFIEQLYTKFLDNPASVDPAWRQFFATLADDKDAARKQLKGPSWARPDWPPAQNGELISAFDSNWPAAEAQVGAKIAAKAKDKGQTLSIEEVRKATMDSVRALMMIRAYRMRGHLAADLDPLKLREPVPQPELDPRSYGFTDADLDRPIFIDQVLGLEQATIRQMVDILQRTYCNTLGVEFMHISDPDQKAWIQERIEGPDKEISFTPEGKAAILNRLIAAEGFEHFLNVKYTGTKRFGLDGGESMIPALEQIVKRGGQLGLREIVLGMAHRGRLNVLANLMKKPFSAIFHEFKGGSSTPDEVEGSGDVKYHLGSSSDRAFDGNTRASLAHRQSLASRDRRSGGAGQGARQAGPARRQRAHQRAAAPHPWRCGFCRPGRGGGMLRAVRASGAIAPAARSISSSTTRSASPRARCGRAPRPIHRMSPR